MPSKRSPLTDYLAKQGRATNRQRAPYTAVHDRRATGLPKGAIGVEDVVADPYPDPNTGIHGRITVTRNVRGDALGQLKARGQVDDAQYQAGREFQKHYEGAEIGALKAANPMKEPVDGGGGIVEVLTDRQRIAVKKLAQARRDLGAEGTKLVNEILGEGWSIEMSARDRNAKTTRDVEFWGKRFRECLNTLAVAYGFSQRSLTPRVECDSTLASEKSC
jgi:hypothetical protein